MNSPIKNSKNQYIPISILDLPPKSSFTIVQAPKSEYTLYKLPQKKIHIEGYKITIQKTKLFNNLEIYEWRRQTQFPISKTHYVNIKASNHYTPDIVQVLVYNEYCPIKLTPMTDVSLSQALYILKESLIGLERLCNKFGFFIVTDNMIRINQKGFCRVWINQNFSINSVMKPEISQQKMVQTTLNTIQKHCDQTRLLKTLFSKLRECKTFLTCLKQIDLFSINSKMPIPNRYVILTSQSPKTVKLNLLSRIVKPEINSANNYRFSAQGQGKKTNRAIHSSSLQKFSNNILPKSEIKQIKKIKSSNSIGLSEMNNQNNAQKNQNNQMMKKSDGQTAYTRNINNTKCSNTNILGSYSPRENSNSKRLQYQTKASNKKSTTDKWLQESSFTIGTQQPNSSLNANSGLIISKAGNSKNIINTIIKDKKDLSYSEAAFNANPENSNNTARNNGSKVAVNININRSSSAQKEKYFDNSLSNSPTLKSKHSSNHRCNTNKNNVGINPNSNNMVQHMGGLAYETIKNKINVKYADQFNNVLQDIIQNSSSNFFSTSNIETSRQFIHTPRSKQHKLIRESNNQILDNSSNEQILRESHTYSVMKSNGWKFTSPLLEEDKELNESFHEGHDENSYIKDFKLQKLQSLGRRGPAMSVLPEEFQELS